MTFGTTLRHAFAAAALFATALPAFATGNCSNGQTLYTTPVSGVACASSSCHKADPSSGANKIKNGANNPARIASAINGGVSDMAIFIGKFTLSDLDDLATWIADAPTCPAGGTPVIAVAPASFAFGAQNVGFSSAPTTLTVSNTGTAAATGLNIANNNAAEFPASNTCTATLANGASCTISVSFAPTASGARSATLTVNSSAGAQTATLSGIGTLAPPGVLSVPGSYAFAAQTVNTASPGHAFTLTNMGGTAVTISSLASSNATEFAISGSTCAGSVAAGANCSFNITFTPSAVGVRAGAVTINSTGTGSPQSISVTGSGTTIAPPGVLSVPGAYAFPTQLVGVAGPPRPFTLANTGGANVTISGIVSDNSAEFAISSSSCTGSIAPGATCVFSVTFTAAATGARSATVAIASSGVGSPQAIPLTGTGSSVAPPGAFTLPAAFAFADQAVGVPSTAQMFTLTNTGGTAVAISGVGSSNAGEFTIVTSTCAGSIAAGAGCSLGVTFTPSALGARSASIVVTSDGVGSPQSFAVSGNGTATAPPPSVGTVSVVEYYYPAFDHYFITTASLEVTTLDSGALSGWVRTGYEFKAYPLGTPGTATVCRFFSSSFAPKSSHFYTDLAYECGLAKTYPAWTFEGEVFNIVSAAADGSCPTGTIPVYRLYNNGQGGAPNHRYVAVAVVRDQMIAKGWVVEGNLPGLAFMCAPQ